MIYNEFRPVIFDEVKGQSIPVKIIRNQSKQNTANAFIFVGKHGTGKTTIAKIFARALNCEHQEDGNPCNQCSSCAEYFNGVNFDITEIDGASNNSVDDVRKIQEQLIYRPQRNKKVYIIDEAHMLSTGAFNALLKTLEEPPKYVLFVLCTTEVNKLPATIRSRCVTIHFQSIPTHEIFNNLEDICQIKGIKYETEGLKLIANIANGSMRDALSMLEKCLSYGELTYLNISDVLGVVDMNTVVDIVKNIITHQPVKALDKVYELYNKGKDFLQLTNDIIRIFRNIMVLQTTKEPSLFDMDVKMLNGISCSEKDCYNAINELSKLLANLKYTDNQKILMDVYLIQVSQLIQIGTIKEEQLPEISVEKEEVESETPSVQTEKDSLVIDHNDYLIYKVDLIKSYEVNSKEVEALVNAQVFTKKDAFIIKTNNPSSLNLEDLQKKLKDITGIKLNIQIKSA
jgi:DNA polymerase-3 subunit gamma/tau